MVCLSKLFKGCLPQILLDPFMNTLPHLPSRENLSQVGKTASLCKSVKLVKLHQVSLKKNSEFRF